jgi:hypothetical protein
LITNKENLPKFLVQSIEYWGKSHDSQADYSATELLDPPRIVALRRKFRDQIEEDASDRIWSLLGSATHKVVESAIEEDGGETLVSEHRMFAELDGVTISGQADVYDRETKTIYDLKTASVWEIINGVRIEREQQLNIYGWLGRQENWEVEHVAAVFILRDWSKTKALNEQNYPASQVVEYKIRMWTDERVEEFLRSRIQMHEQAKEQLPFCTQEDKWTRPTKFAVMGNGRKSAFRLLDSMQDAQAWMRSNKKGNTVVERPGEDVRCESYCSVQPFCSQYKASKVKE